MPEEREQWLTRGFVALQSGDATSAAEDFRLACEADGTDAEALNLWGVALQQLGRSAEARAAFEAATGADPSWSDAVYNLAEALAGQGETTAAAAAYERCVALDPDHSMAWRRLFTLRGTGGDAPAAAVAGLRAVALAPNDHRLALTVGRAIVADPARVADALPLFSRAAEAMPERLEPQVLLSKAATVLGHREQAISAVERAVALAPDDPKVLLDHITTLRQCGQVDRAVDAGVAYVKRFPDDAEGHYRLAVALILCREFGAASLAAARAVELRPDADTQMLLGDIFVRMGRSRDAIEPLQRAMELMTAPVAMSRLLLSTAQESLGRRADAISQVRLLIEAEPDHHDALSWLATLLVRQGDHGEGRSAYDRALTLNPKHVPSLCGLGMLAASQADPEGAWDHIRRAIAAAPEDPYPCVAGLLGINGHPSLDAEALFDLHLEWARRLRARVPPPDRAWANDPDPNRPLRVGYVSPDLRAHSVAYFTEPLLAARDRSNFEVFVFDSSPVMDNISHHIRQMVDGWVRVVGAGDERVAELVRDHRIDILVDLAGHTADSRVDVFARHPAPVQVAYLGYPNTTGLSEIDYRLTDAIADPPGVSDRYHVERLVRLPGGFLCFRPPVPHPTVGPVPAGADGPITFASFNAIHKVNGPAIVLWSRVIRAVKGSTLLMKSSGLNDPHTRALLLARFADAGIDPERIRFAERTATYRDHLEMYGQCDIALDTFPYNGTTTTCESLWMGVPVVALAGDRHAARVSLSILTQVGLPELAGDTPDDYVRIAVDLAADRPRLSHLRASLRDRMRASRLMDARAHAAAVEAAYRSMWRTWCSTAPAAAPEPTGLLLAGAAAGPLVLNRRRRRTPTA